MMMKNSAEIYTNYRSRIPIQVRMTDLDALGHVNNGVIYSYYDTGRLHYFAQIGEDTSWDTFDKVLVRTECDFRRSILYGDEIYVDTAVIGIGDRSVRMMQRIIDSGGMVRSTCLSILSGYDRQMNASKKIPADFRVRVNDFENGKTPDLNC